MIKRIFDLEDRTLLFSKNCITVCTELIPTIVNRELIIQLIRSSGSVGANYREANNASAKKEFYHRIGICRKEAKESEYWLQLLMHSCNSKNGTILQLADEALQLSKIFAAIRLKRTS